MCSGSWSISSLLSIQNFFPPVSSKKITKQTTALNQPVLCKDLQSKVHPVQALRLCTGRTAHRESRGLALPFHGHSTRIGWGVSVRLRPLLTPGKYPVPIVQEAGWAQGPVSTGAENLAPPPGFDCRTVQPVASRHTDWATRPTNDL
jgi:hypothetical protein